PSSPCSTQALASSPVRMPFDSKGTLAIERIASMRFQSSPPVSPLNVRPYFLTGGWPRAPRRRGWLRPPLLASSSIRLDPRLRSCRPRSRGPVAYTPVGPVPPTLVTTIALQPQV